jgi:hypothetical protein
MVDERHLLLSGTSMSCPHIAGIVALMLQADPSLPISKVREILRRSALHDSETGPDWNVTWGAGKVSASGAVRTVLGIGWCGADSDCSEGRTCAGNRCIQKQGGKCYLNADCAGPFACVGGVCAEAPTPEPDAGTDSGSPYDSDGGGGEPGSGCSCSAVGVEGGDEKGAIRETGLDELSNKRSQKGRTGPTADEVFGRLETSGFKTAARSEVLGRLVGASYCAGSESSGLKFTVCEYTDGKEAAGARTKRAVLFGGDAAEAADGGTLISVQMPEDPKLRAKVNDLLKAFSTPVQKKPPPPDKK